MNVTRLRYVALMVPDLAASLTFLTAGWGLEERARDDGRAYLSTCNGEPFQLALVSGPERRIERIGFALDSRGAIDAAHETLNAAGVPIVEPPHALATPGGGYGFAFLDPDRRCIEFASDVALERPRAAVSVPEYLQHVVLNTPDIDRATGFYLDVLGFRLSDWSEHQMAFLRCNAEHHAVAFNAAAHAAYNHTAWKMASLDDLFRGQGRLRSLGKYVDWGTGRHGPGSDVFSYFIEPSGFVLEYSADGQQIVDESAWTPQVWERSPKLMDTWGTAGFPSAEIRAAMTGLPDPGYETANR